MTCYQQDIPLVFGFETHEESVSLAQYEEESFYKSLGNWNLEVCSSSAPE
jgi:hypothetical protein